MKVFAITGPRGKGKTSLLGELVKRLEGRGARPFGFLQRRVEYNNRVVAYELEDVATGVRRLLCVRSKDQRDRLEIPFRAEHGDWWFDEAAFEWAGRLLEHGAGDLAVVDEVGRLERAGRGHWPAVEKLLADARPWVLMVTLQWDSMVGLARRLGRVDAWARVGRLKGWTRPHHVLPLADRWEAFLVPWIRSGSHSEERVRGATVA